MKKVLFATTALVASAGVAAAEVAVSGSAEMGIFGGTGIETQFFQSVDVRFTMTGETDNGLSFGATIDLDDAVDHAIGGVDHVDSTGFSDFTVFLSGNFGTITMGDTDGAMDWAMQEVGLGGAIADDHTAHLGYNGNAFGDGAYDGQVLRYDHSIGDFGFAVSALMDDTGAGDTMLSVGATYGTDLGGTDLGLGFGYASDGTTDIWGISVDASMSNGLRLVLNYSDLDPVEHIGIGASYSMDALTIAANYGEYSSGGLIASGYGLAVNYDLGGGAEVQFGYGSSNPLIGADFNTFSLGVAMSF